MHRILAIIMVPIIAAAALLAGSDGVTDSQRADSYLVVVSEGIANDEIVAGLRSAGAEEVRAIDTIGVYVASSTRPDFRAAAADNELGVIGVAPEAEIVAVKVLATADGYGTWEGILEGIVYAADIDCDVINMSLSGYLNRRGGWDDNGTADPSDDIWLDANHAQDFINLPGGVPKVLNVSATGPIGWGSDPTTDLDLLAVYSNHGQSEIDLAAPGGNADLTFPEGWHFDLVISTAPGNWAWAAGTSMAAPHFAGVAALIIGENGGSMMPSAVEKVLRQSSDDLGKPGRDDAYGHGRINAYNAVK